MNTFNDDEWAVIQRQGWNSDSLNAVLASYDPATGDRVTHMRRIAQIENENEEPRVFDEPEDVPGLTVAELIGKTIARIEQATVPGAWGHEPAVLLHFTDGTAHTFVLPGDED